MPVPVVRPTRLVWRLAHMRLRESSVYRFPPPGGFGYPAARMVYLFGRLPAFPGDGVNWAATHPLYLTVEEIWPYKARTKPAISHIQGEWNFIARFPAENLGVHIESNLPGPIVWRIGLRLLHLKPRVKGPGKG